MTLLASLLALFSCKQSPQERKATNAFTPQSFLTYEYCGQNAGFQYFSLGNHCKRKMFKIKNSEISIEAQYTFSASQSFQHKIPITPIPQQKVCAQITATHQKLYLYDQHLTLRYFLNCSDLHKKNTPSPTYLYDEITKEEAQKHQHQRAYYIGYYSGKLLTRYQKIYKQTILIDKVLKNQ